MTTENSWYTKIERNESISQGEIIKDCPVIIPPKKLEQKRYTLNGELYDVIVISQTCDIIYDKIEYILVCPYYSLSSLENIPFFKNSTGKEVLRRGNIVGLHLLNRCEIYGEYNDFLVVDFRKVYSIYKKFLFNFVKSKDKRICLTSPYREHMSQAFARFFMRVGLPTDIPPFASDIYKI